MLIPKGGNDQGANGLGGNDLEGNVMGEVTKGGNWEGRGGGRKLNWGKTREQMGLGGNDLGGIGLGGLNWGKTTKEGGVDAGGGGRGEGGWSEVPMGERCLISYKVVRFRCFLHKIQRMRLWLCTAFHTKRCTWQILTLWT